MSGRANTQFSVAVHVLVYLAGPGIDRPVSSDELAVSANVNPVYVRRVLGPLREAGIVRSRPGAQGGWELVRDPASVRLDEIWQLVHGGAVLATHGPDPKCPVGRQVQAVLTGLETDIAAAVERELHGRTVADVVTTTRSSQRPPRR